MSVKEMIKKEIDKLPKIFLQRSLISFVLKEKERIMIAKASQDLSTASFPKIWDNEEDAIYDSS